MGKIISDLMINNKEAIISYIFLSTLCIVILIISRLKSKKDFMRLKKETISFGFIKREYQPEEDKFLLELWADNQRLEKELSALKKEYNKLSIWVLIVLIFALVFSKLGEFTEKSKHKANKLFFRIKGKDFPEEKKG